jgi:hypothetical protein
MNSEVVPITVERMPHAFCGAAANRNKLIMMTIERQGDAFAVSRHASAEFVLDSDSQASLRRFRQEVEHFVRDGALNMIVLRGGQRTGTYASGPDVVRMETALELIPGLRVRRVHHNSLRAWRRYSRERLPKPDTSLPRADATLHWEAIVAARLAYGIQVEGDKLVNGKIK